MITPVLPEAVARRYWQGYAVVDVETSGLSPQHHRVLQVAVAQVNAAGALESRWSTLLDPGCDPGPVHIHGLTRQRLAGSPTFADIAPTVLELVRGRVLVAHNARFDWQFLAAEADRANGVLPTRSRLCTIALSRRLDLPLASLSLDALASYWGVPRMAAHDAADDTRVLIEVLRHSLVVAERLQATLPLANCDPSQLVRALPPSAPRPPCRWTYPGRWEPGHPLRQGSKVSFTGDTVRPREELIREAASAGMDVMNNVSSRTSVLVRNPGSAETRKSKAAQTHGTACVDEATWSRLMSAVAAGTAKGTPPEPSLAPATVQSHGGPAVVSRQSRPLAKHRVLVLGGTHADAAAVREQIVELGGQAAANLTATVTHAVLLDGASRDPRHAKVIGAGLAQLRPDTFEPLVLLTRRTSLANTPPGEIAEPVVLGHGAVTDLPGDMKDWSIAIAWPDHPDQPAQPEQQITIDVVALVVDADEQVRADEDFCFYNQPIHPTGAVELDLDLPNEALALIRPNQLPREQRRVVLAAAIDGQQTFGDVGPIEITARTPQGAIVVRSTLDAATSERSMLLATVYERSGTWRLRALGQGYEAGLAHLAVLHGVDIED